MIGGKAPSKYLQQIREHTQVQISMQDQDDLLQTHLIDPALLRTDDFKAFYEARKSALVAVIEQAMGKSVLAAGGDAPAEDAEDDDPDE
jgi:hypothetical protein